MLKDKRNTTKTIVTLSFLAALSIILSRFCGIYITNSLRISLGNIPIILAGAFLGPIGGALVGAVSDILGSVLLSGLGWYPPLTLSPMLMGIIPGLLAPLIVRMRGRSVRAGGNGLLSEAAAAVCLVMPADIIASMGWTTYCLHLLYGSPMGTLLSVRIPLYLCIGAVEVLVIFTLHKAGVFRALGLKLYGGVKREL